MKTKEIVVPDIGGFEKVEIIELLVAVGDTIAAEDSLITVESDKASMEIPSSDGGVIKELKVRIGDYVAEGSVLAIIETSQSAGDDAPAEKQQQTQDVAVAATQIEEIQEKETQPVAKPTPAPTPVTKTSPTANIDEVSFTKAYASPSLRRFARELGVDLGQVNGSGRKDRIVKEDIKSFVKRSMQSGGGTPASSATALGVAPMPEVDFSQWGEVETVALSKINKLTGDFLHRNWVTIPHVTQYDEADITEMEAFRKQMGKEFEKEGVKITPLAFIMKAVIAGLKAYPRFNSSLDASKQNRIQKSYYHIGVAVDTPDGLVVPVIRDADQKSLVEISQEIRELALKARDKKLKPADMQGGCFSISSLGGIGGTKFTPIINAPEVAILGVSRSKMQPEWNGTEFEPRLMLPLSLSYDHRVIDGADGARFTSFLSKTLSDIRRLLL
ncbi:MAG: dihydrolipoyllysine-residue acetyltransferase [Thiotrichaceae bacterium]